MDRLCDEILQLIIQELDDPTPFTLLAKRYHQFSQDDYVRASYFLARHGRMQAMYWALGRGKLMNEHVIDTLIGCGAHVSRYLVQVAIHHYFRTSSHFIKTNWVRWLPFPVFSHFLKVASSLYGDIPVGKGDDDGSLFSSFLNESRFPATMKTVKWEEIKEIIEKYKFMPFCNKDPAMATFPLALAIEPRLLPYAEANGFQMDSKYRDFVFRKMFERPNISADSRTEDIVRNVRELCRLDSKMFLTRTVAAEVCMEANVNAGAYEALKELDKSGDLKFELRDVIEELMRLFVRTRSITTPSVINVIRQLWNDYRSKDPTVRLVVLLTVFLSDNCLVHTTPATLQRKLDELGLTPLTRTDIYNVLVNPFIERYVPIIEYAKEHVKLNAEGVKELVEDVAVKCLEVGCKGKLLRKLYDGFPFLEDTITTVVMQKYQTRLDDLPLPDDEMACAAYEAPLCRDFIVPRADLLDRADSTASGAGVTADSRSEDHGMTEGVPMNGMVVELATDAHERLAEADLGRVHQDTLTTMIQLDELSPTRLGRRRYHSYGYGDVTGKLHYPADPLQVGRWIRQQFGNRSPVSAIFMTHAIINDNPGIIQQYLSCGDIHPFGMGHVPVTLKHFKILQRLGRAPTWSLFAEIEKGAEFFFGEEDYLSSEQLNGSSYSKHGHKVKVKVEAPQSNVGASASSSKGESSGRKRPRRSAAASVKSYVVPDSDDETIADDSIDLGVTRVLKALSKKRKVESNLQRWIKHLTVLLKEEQKKYKEKKKRLEKTAPAGTKLRVPKSEFFRCLATNLRDLRKVDLEKRRQLYGSDVPEEDCSEADDDDYQEKVPRPKRRKVTHRNTDIE